jgi:hypothetical protein
VGGSRSRYRKGETFIQNSDTKNLNICDNLEDLGTDGIITEKSQRNRVEVDLIHPAQDRNQWWVLMNTVMSLRVA